MAINWRKREKELSHGIINVRLNSWREFLDYIDNIHNTTGTNKQYIWRGHRESKWLLQSSLQRALFEQWVYPFEKSKNVLTEISIKYKFDERYKNLDPKLSYLLDLLGPNEELVKQHLHTFKLSLRGRRGVNPAAINSENEWWALGQHYGLLTPLIDWTGSPFVGSFFAFEGLAPDHNGEVAVFGLWEQDIETACFHVTEKWKRKNNNILRPPIIEFIRPLSDENSRLVNQRGLFSKGPIIYDLETWMRTFLRKDHDSHSLIKITLPYSIREEALFALNRMNINHLSLYPDIIGAANYSNLAMLNQGYEAG